MLQIQRFVFNPFYENTYVIWEDESKEAALIDPGCFDESEKDVLTKFIYDNSLKINYLINTHCHIDHIIGNSFIKEKYNPKFLAPEKDMYLLKSIVKEAGKYFIEVGPSPMPDEFLSEQTQINLNNISCKIIATPGHTPGGTCLYFEKEKACFTGDVLFNRTIGRTDLSGGDYDALIDSIKNKLFNLPDDVKIYPGHDSSSKIGEEKRFNPFFN